jgi:hypothetical protein
MSPVGTFKTSTDVRYTAAFGGNADISQRLPDNRGFYEYTAYGGRRDFGDVDVWRGLG